MLRGKHDVSILIAGLQTFPPTTCGLCGGGASNEDFPPVLLGGRFPPGEMIGPDICFGAEMVGFLDLFVFLSDIPLLSDILLQFGCLLLVSEFTSLRAVQAKPRWSR